MTTPTDLTSWAESLARSVAEIVGGRDCHPAATYRLQFEPEHMTFRAAAAIVPYLDELGVSHVYASPYLKTRAGSKHGYAIVDYSRLNPELGEEGDYRGLVAALHARGIGQVLDIVPNHMSATPGENAWWTDVLENGPASPYAAYFDIDWRPVKEELRDRLLLPVLGDQYGQVLEAGELKLEYRGGAFFLGYGLMSLPIDPRSYRTILAHGLDRLRGALPPDSADLRELESVLTALEHLPERTETDPPRVIERLREKEVVKGRLRALTDRAAEIAVYLARTVAEFNGTPGNAGSFDDLDRLLDAQVYRLSHWKAAADEINYRRFFDINELAAVCTEDPQVFAESHRLVFELLVRGDVDGLRIDHIDGLYDPMEYLRRLQKEYLIALGKELYKHTVGQASRLPATSFPRSAWERTGWPLRGPVTDSLTGTQSVPQVHYDAERRHEAAAESSPPPPWSDIEPLFVAAATGMTCTDSAKLPLYVVVEKILAAGETLPEQWLLAGTTGYDFLNCVSGLFVHPAGLVEVAKTYGRFIDGRPDFPRAAEEAKLLVFHAAMSSELQLLAHRLNRISQRRRRSRDFTLNALRTALREILVCFPVYRTYVREGYVPIRDRQVISRAAARAKRRNPASNAAVFDFIRDLLLLEDSLDLDETGRRERELFVGRVQQVTSPLMAKGIEDTAFYRCFPLASLNEVGGDPGRGAVSVEEFHRQNSARQAAFPRSLLASTTHDTKRSEDARARIGVLTEVPGTWRTAVNRWARLNRRLRREVDGQPAPSRNDEYLFYQTLVGIWPLAPPHGRDLEALAARVAAYMEKATREAKIHSSWINPNTEYDAAIRGFVAAALDERPKNRFLADFRQFQESIVPWGLYAALSQLLLKLTSPGVPDIYQGQELWDFSLVDPDNRRPVDFALRRKMLAQLGKEAGRNDRSLLALARRLAQDPRDPRLKLFVTARVLQFRRRHADLFRQGDYVPLEVSGPRARHVVAFARTCPSPSSTGREIAVVIAPRFLAELMQGRGEEAGSGEHARGSGILPLGRGGGVAFAPRLGSAVWEDTQVALGEMPSSRLLNVLTGQVLSFEDARLPVAAALSDFPVALLASH